MYARIALGKASSIDVIGGETSGMAGQLLALLPFLFLLQGWQLFMGVNMMRHSAPAMLDPEGWLARFPLTSVSTADPHNLPALPPRGTPLASSLPITQRSGCLRCAFNW